MAGTFAATNRYYVSAATLINDVAVEVGFDANPDPVGSTERQFVQLTRLLNIGIEELSEAHEWEEFTRNESFLTNAVTYPNGVYPLPIDFHYMIPQTQWDRTNDVPIAGPLSPQQWTYLKGRDLVSSTIYASFRPVNGELALFPTPPPDGIDVTFEYQSTNWVRNANDTDYTRRVEASGDSPLLPPSLVRAFLKAKFLGAKGFQTVTAQEAVSYFLESAGAKDKGAPILNMGRGGSRFPYLNPWYNLPDTKYGSY